MVRRDAIASRLAEAMAARRDIHELVGPDGVDMMRDNSANLCRFMGSMFSSYVPEVLVETILWVFRAYRAHGFQVAFWPANLATLLEVLRAELPPDAFRVLAPFFDWMVVNIPVFVELTNPGAEGGT
jgi:hypothetical protein